MIFDNHATSAVKTATFLLNKYRYLLKMPDIPSRKCVRKGRTIGIDKCLEIFDLHFGAGLSRLATAEKTGVHYNTVLSVLTRHHRVSKTIPKHKNET
jgi:hypothetical protein